MDRNEALPKICDYLEKTPVLPSGTENINVTCFPVNGAVFSPGQQIVVDLNNIGYLDPASILIRYKLSLTTPLQTAQANGTSYSVVGCPVYAPFLRADLLFNSNVVESINNYNVVCTALSNLQMSISDKMGQQSSLGYMEQQYALSALGVPTLTTDYSIVNENTDGLTVVATNGATTTVATTFNYFLSAPLIGALNNAEKLIPLNATNIRIQLTLDALANICPTATTNISGTAPTQGGAFANLSISNFEIVYNQVQFPPQIERMMLNMSKIRIKTSSYATGLQSIPAGVAGTVNLVYNLRYASIRSMFLLLGASTANATNKLFDSIDITSGQGSYNFQINGMYYPQNPLSTVNNRGGIMSELRRAMQNIYTGNNAMSINNTEWLRGDTTVTNTATNTTSVVGVTNTPTSINVPSKFIVGTSCQKLFTPGIFTGQSSQNSPITASIQIGATLTGLSYSPILVLLYDAIIEIDTLTKQINYIF